MTIHDQVSYEKYQDLDWKAHELAVDSIIGPRQEQAKDYLLPMPLYQVIYVTNADTDHRIQVYRHYYYLCFSYVFAGPPEVKKKGWYYKVEMILKNEFRYDNKKSVNCKDN